MQFGEGDGFQRRCLKESCHNHSDGDDKYNNEYSDPHELYRLWSALFPTRDG